MARRDRPRARSADARSARSRARPTSRRATTLGAAADPRRGRRDDRGDDDGRAERVRARCARHRRSAREVGRERGVRIDADARLTPNGIAVSRSHDSPGDRRRDSCDGRRAVRRADRRGGSRPTGAASTPPPRSGSPKCRPLPFGAALTGTARLDRAPGEPFRLELHNIVDAARRARAPRRSTATSSSSSTAIAGARTRAIAWARPSSRGASAALESPGGERSTFEGDLIASYRRRRRGRALRRALRTGDAGIVRDARGPLDANVTMGGIFTAPRFVGRARRATASRCRRSARRRSPPTSTLGARAQRHQHRRDRRIAAARHAATCLANLRHASPGDGQLHGRGAVGGRPADRRAGGAAPAGPALGHRDAWWHRRRPEIAADVTGQRADARRPAGRLADGESAHGRRRA